jgi:hypothetical protein
MIFGANQALIEVHAKLPDNRTIVGRRAFTSDSRSVAVAIAILSP